MIDSPTSTFTSSNSHPPSRLVHLCPPLLVLSVTVLLTSPACSPHGTVTGACSQDHECGRGAHCLHDQCVSSCSYDYDCEAPLRCRPHPDLGGGSACFMTVSDPDDAPPPSGSCDEDTNTGGSGPTLIPTGGSPAIGGMAGSTGIGGTAPFSCPPDSEEVAGPDADFVDGGLGTAGTWQGSFHSFAAPDSEIFPDCFSTDRVCVEGTLSPGFDQWANLGWAIFQDIDPLTSEAGPIRSASPGGDGIIVETANLGGNSLRVQIQTDPEATEFWCAPLASSGSAVLRWEDFRKECWLPGGEPYDGVTPLSQIVVQAPGTSATSPTPFHYCLTNIAPFVEP